MAARFRLSVKQKRLGHCGIGAAPCAQVDPREIVFRFPTLTGLWCHVSPYSTRDQVFRTIGRALDQFDRWSETSARPPGRSTRSRKTSRRDAGHRARGRPGHSRHHRDRKSTRLNSSHLVISYAVFCLKKKKKK